MRVANSEEATVRIPVVVPPIEVQVPLGVVPVEVRYVAVAVNHRLGALYEKPSIALSLDVSVKPVKTSYDCIEFVILF